MNESPPRCELEEFFNKFYNLFVMLCYSDLASLAFTFLEVNIFLSFCGHSHRVIFSNQNFDDRLFSIATGF